MDGFFQLCGTLKLCSGEFVFVVLKVQTPTTTATLQEMGKQETLEKDVEVGKTHCGNMPNRGVYATTKKRRTLNLVSINPQP